MNKKLVASIVIVLVVVGISIYSNVQSEKVASLVRVDNVNFVPTNEPVDATSIGKPIGQVNKKIARQTTPTRNNESNSLSVGTKLYEFIGDKQPTKVLVYEDDGSKYIARENIVNK
ncbi:hypothetical protein [Paenilisteria rocourtiae]|uniref:Uncharacterized protein n=1 Tax=Listeria rocourtiae TaxID=647910 RepID=A0A4R6ZSP2_9LIST|nr:hypothetical protein [Listeria rocourtiae]EUJ43142.1 hypothetical protein PROCOU_15924 [Listeria rocourtiae FSL F6-920]TDR55588.1 hypothetical protein DFP96_101525 [Listeria rocourtiae]